MKHKILTWMDVENYTLELARKIAADDWRPDYVVGITRGGLVPATLLSNWFGVPMETLKVQLRDGGECETNAWMSEDAFGYVDMHERELIKSRWDNSKRKNILLVDDINDSGATFEWIKQDWQGSCLPSEEIGWNSVWGKNVRFAVLVENLDSKFDTCYNAIEINKAEEDCWIDFPWESGWWYDHKRNI